MSSLKERVRFTRSWDIIDNNGKIITKYSAKEYGFNGNASWFIINPPKRDKLKIVHPATFPEQLVKDIISFFCTKKSVVFDPFMGTGTTIVEAIRMDHIGIGIEIEKKFYEIALKRVEQISKQNKEAYLFNDDARNILKIWKNNKLRKVDITITSPPYWNQLKKKYLRQVRRVKKNLPTDYSEDNPKNLGNIDDYFDFLKELIEIFNNVYRITKEGGYLVVIINNIYHKGLVYPLAFDLAIHLSNLWTLRDEKIWLQDNKRLLALGKCKKWIANRHHHYMLVFRKVSKNLPLLRDLFKKRIKMIKNYKLERCFNEKVKSENNKVEALTPD